MNVRLLVQVADAVSLAELEALGEIGDVIGDVATIRLPPARLPALDSLRPRVGIRRAPGVG